MSNDYNDNKYKTIIEGYPNIYSNTIEHCDKKHPKESMYYDSIDFDKFYAKLDKPVEGWRSQMIQDQDWTKEHVERMKRKEETLERLERQIEAAQKELKDKQDKLAKEQAALEEEKVRVEQVKKELEDRIKRIEDEEFQKSDIVRLM